MDHESVQLIQMVTDLAQYAKKTIATEARSYSRGVPVHDTAEIYLL